MKCITIVGGLMALGFSAGCGSATDTTSGSVIMNGGGGAGGGTAGTGFTPIGTGGTAGAAMGGSGGTTTIAGSGGNGAASGTGGNGNGGNRNGAASGTGGSGGQGPTGVPGYPSGPVVMCFGAGCPLGECDNDLFFEPTACSTLYTGDIGPTSSYCKAAETDSYCVKVGSEFAPDFSVGCVNGVATVMKCTSGCGSFGTGGYQCI